VEMEVLVNASPVDFFDHRFPKAVTKALQEFELAGAVANASRVLH
jgi:hypothetical protein